ncbi:MAG: hypothetical protein IKZ00_06460 [Bacteroidaceae bacterium]|nr:hypothetical protein [Bacteroidaceae bacterium]
MRLIDADAIHKFVEDKVAEGKDGWANGVGYEWAWTLTAIDMQPTIDAVPVARCGECERRSKSADLTYTIYCPWIGQQMDKTDFCSYGERKDGDA